MILYVGIAAPELDSNSAHAHAHAHAHSDCLARWGWLARAPDGRFDCGNANVNASVERNIIVERLLCRGEYK